MKQHNKSVFVVILYLFGCMQAMPGKPNYSNHRNYKLLPQHSECGTNENALEDKIFGGVEASLGDFQWMARLKYKLLERSAYLCAGSLINERYVLTAAHCVNGPLQVIEVRLGEHDARTNPDMVQLDETTTDTADPVIDVDIEKIIIHEKYNSTNKHNDIALIRLKRNISYTKWVAPVCLPLNGESAPDGAVLIVAGWGLTENNMTSPVKLKTNVALISQKYCSTVYGAVRTIVPTQICAGGEKDVDSCSGDSGGPLLNSFDKTKEKFYLEGIVSFGSIKCGKKGVPGIYTKVSNYINWILDNMEESK